MSEKPLYKNEKGNILIKKFDLLFKEKIYSLLLNSDLNEINLLDIFDDSLNKDNIKEKLDLLILDKNIQIYILEANQELIGIYFLNQFNNDPYISFIIEKEKRNKGYGKLGLFLFIKELSNTYPNIKLYFFKIKKNNIWANLIISGNNAEIQSENESEIIFKIEKGNNIWIHRIEIDDLNKIMSITNDAKNLLKQNGSLQWQQGYPNEDTFKIDIKNKSLYGIYQDKELMGYGAYIFGKDENYVEIEGKWDIPANDKDLAIHRVAVDKNCHGKQFGMKILKYGIIYAKNLGCPTVKVDTHKNNIPMQKSIIKSGFIYKGVVKIIRDKLDNLRLAYEIVL
jgi:predicted acetyltransferase